MLAEVRRFAAFSRVPKVGSGCGLGDGVEVVLLTQCFEEIIREILAYARLNGNTVVAVIAYCTSGTGTGTKVCANAEGKRTSSEKVIIYAHSRFDRVSSVSLFCET